MIVTLINETWRFRIHIMETNRLERIALWFEKNENETHPIYCATHRELCRRQRAKTFRSPKA